MADETRNQLKTYFETGDIPTQDEFGNLIDSMINKKDDGITIIPDVTGGTTQVGINNTAPDCPLAIRSNNKNTALCLTSYTPGSEFHIAVNPAPDGTTVYNGLDINEGGNGLNTSRLFIKKGTGMVGVGTTNPEARMHLKDASTDSATTLKIENAEVHNEKTSSAEAWQLGQIHDSGIAERNGAFSIMEETTSDSLNERITILPGKNTGINHPTPSTVLHIYGNPANDASRVQLIDGTGIVTIGPSDGTNLVLDFNAIQARTGTATPNNAVIKETPVALNLQPLGGELTVHTNISDVNAKIIVKEDGKVGMGMLTPLEKLHLNGAVVVGASSNTEPAEGTIRYNPATRDLEGFVNSTPNPDWLSLTKTNTAGEYWRLNQSGELYYVSSTDSIPTKVGIGNNDPATPLHVTNAPVTDSSDSVTVLVENNAKQRIATDNSNRYGLVVNSTATTWNGQLNGKDIGIYVRGTNADSGHQEIAAILSGNVVIGSNNLQVIGTNGENVLAIQNGVKPEKAVGAGDDGIQIYSSNLTGTETSVFHVMNGDGNVIRLYRQSGSMTAESAVIPNSGDVNTDALINNLRTRVKELEQIMKNLGILA
jgi:hypothetical protein